MGRTSEIQKEFNRLKNERLFKDIIKSIGNPEDRKTRQGLNKLFGERKSWRAVNGKGVLTTYNNLSSSATTIKFEKVLSQVNSGTFNIKQRLKNNVKYKENKSYIGNSTNDILKSLVTEEYYYDNRELFKDYNKSRKENGKHNLSTENLGVEIEQTIANFIANKK